MAGKSGSNKKQGSKSNATRNAKPLKAAPQPQPPEDRSFLREVLGVVVMGAGLLLLYFCFAEGEAAEAVVDVLRGLAGSLFFLLPLIVVWLGALVTFAGKERRVRPGRVLLTLMLPLIFAAGWHVFYYEDITKQMTPYSFLNFVNHSYHYTKGGAGALGALLSWPIHRGLMGENPFGSVLMLAILLVADLILLRKISLRKLGGKVKQSYDVYVEHARQRADEKRQAAQQRMQAMVVPTVYAAPGGAVEVPVNAGKPVKLRAPRAKLPDSDDLTSWDAQKPPAKGRFQRPRDGDRAHPAGRPLPASRA